MKLKGIPGEFFFRGLIYNGVGYWKLTEGYYSSFKELEDVYGEDVKWPVEIMDDGSIYVPDTSELENND